MGKPSDAARRPSGAGRFRGWKGTQKRKEGLQQGRIHGISDDLTLLRLVEAHCVPVLTYGIEIAQFSDARKGSKIRAAYNSCS